MDFIRYGLIACIIAVGLFIANQWADFSEQNHLATTTSAAAEKVSSSDLPSVSVSASTSSDLPEVETTVSDVATVAAKPAATNLSELITVTTPTLALKISLEGGDIVHAAFPKHKTSLDEDLGSFTLLEQNATRTYIAQSGLIGRNGTDTTEGRAQYTSAQSSYTLDDGSESLTVDLVQTLGDVTITKRYTLNADSYAVNVQHIIANNSNETWSAAEYAQLRRDNTDDPGAISGGMGMSPYLGAATSLKDKPYDKIEFKNFEKFEKQETTNTYIAIVQHYFVGAWIPQTGKEVTVSTRKSADGQNLIRYVGGVTDIAAGTTGEYSSQLYVGPKDQYVLEELAPGLDLTVDYGLLWWIAQPIYFFLYQLNGILGNWGWSIIILTLGIKAIFFPLSATSYRSMAKMRKLTPRMQSIKENYASDRQRQSQEMMALYQKEKVNPLGGCLPILVQMPVFIALYWVLSESVELRHTPWLGWIQDLSARDPYFILPVIMAASMFFQQKLNPPPPDPMQAKVMQFMPIMFGVFFLFFPAGLVLYWVVNNLLSIAQQWYITRQIEAQDS